MNRDHYNECINRAFRAGLDYGCENRERVSSRFVSDLHPNYGVPEIDAFMAAIAKATST